MEILYGRARGTPGRKMSGRWPATLCIFIASRAHWAYIITATLIDSKFLMSQLIARDVAAITGSPDKNRGRPRFANFQGLSRISRGSGLLRKKGVPGEDRMSWTRRITRCFLARWERFVLLPLNRNSAIKVSDFAKVPAALRARLHFGAVRLLEGAGEDIFWSGWCSKMSFEIFGGVISKRTLHTPVQKNINLHYSPLQ